MLRGVFWLLCWLAEHHGSWESKEGTPTWLTSNQCSPHSREPLQKQTTHVILLSHQALLASATPPTSASTSGGKTKELMWRRLPGASEDTRKQQVNCPWHYEEGDRYNPGRAISCSVHCHPEVQRPVWASPSSKTQFYSGTVEGNSARRSL